MTLPNAENAQIPDNKITKYLLDFENPQNKGKALFYEKIGYSLENFEILRIDLQKLVKTGEVKEILPNIEGTKYVVVGTINAPNGKTYELKTIWIIEQKHEFPRLVSAYPNK